MPGYLQKRNNQPREMPEWEGSCVQYESESNRAAGKPQICGATNWGCGSRFQPEKHAGSSGQTTERALYVVNESGVIHWSYVSPVGVNLGANGILSALEELNKDQNEK